MADADLVMLFGSRSLIRDASFFGSIHAAFPHAIVAGCSTAGEIAGTHVSDHTLVCTAVSFARTNCRMASMRVASPADSFAVGVELASRLSAPDLRHVLVFSDGLHVNGTELVNGLQSGVPAQIALSGGLAGDGERFAETYVIADGQPVEKHVTAIGLYGDALSIGCGSFGGWDPFGPERLITRARGNILYELDGHSALDCYKRYLGDYAKALPASALLFPLAIRTSPGTEHFVRTVLAISEDDQSMTFAGDIPEGHYASFMKCNMDRLIDGASTAARIAFAPVRDANEGLALLVSCVGRKMVLKQRVEEEVEAVRDILGNAMVLTGFYSYGEISPLHTAGPCSLLNQTMTITTLSETHS